jgi:hypothetical protein
MPHGVGFRDFFEWRFYIANNARMKRFRCWGCMTWGLNTGNGHRQSWPQQRQFSPSPRILGGLRDLTRAHAPEAITELARLAKDAKSETARIAAAAAEVVWRGRAWSTDGGRDLTEAGLNEAANDAHDRERVYDRGRVWRRRRSSSPMVAASVPSTSRAMTRPSGRRAPPRVRSARPQSRSSWPPAAANC